jgi:hypothetical protein
MENTNTAMRLAQEPNYPRPFIYIFQTTGLNTNQDYASLNVPMQGDYPFTLRRISGLTTGVGPSVPWSQMLLYDAARSRRFSSAFPVVRDFPLVPGIVYPADSQIQFDLRISGSAFFPTQLVFQGVKHVWGSSYGYQTPYPYYEKPQTYTRAVTITDAAGTSPQLITVPMFSRDFELLKIVMSITTADGLFANTAPQNLLAVELFDSMGHALQSAPVRDTFVNYADNTYINGWPVPSLTWPANGEIRLLLHSLMSAPALPATLKLEFHGINRFPHVDGDQIVRQRNVSGT